MANAELGIMQLHGEEAERTLGPSVGNCTAGDAERVKQENRGNYKICSCQISQLENGFLDSSHQSQLDSLDLARMGVLP
jgi:hypothetical protein